MVGSLLAGAVGTAAMTVSERLEMALTGRSPSQVPGRVGAHLLPGRNARSASDVDGLNSAVHWGHGVLMGSLRGVLDVVGVRGPRASAVHLALLWSGDAGLYRALGIADLPWRWRTDELATDLLHKGVYAATTGFVYDVLLSSR